MDKFFRYDAPLKNDSYNLVFNHLQNAPHTQDVVTAELWDRPYSREVAAFPAVSTECLIVTTLLSRHAAFVLLHLCSVTCHASLCRSTSHLSNFVHSQLLSNLDPPSIILHLCFNENCLSRTKTYRNNEVKRSNISHRFSLG